MYISDQFMWCQKLNMQPCTSLIPRLSPPFFVWGSKVIHAGEPGTRLTLYSCAYMHLACWPSSPGCSANSLSGLHLETLHGGQKLKVGDLWGGGGGGTYINHILERD